MVDEPFSLGLAAAGYPGFGAAFFPRGAAPPLPIMLWASLFAIAGAAVGSFLGLVSLRLPKGEEWVLGRSHCSGCGRTLRARDLVPLLSFALLRGRCRTCVVTVERRYPAIEGAAALVGLVSALALPGWEAVAGAVLGWWLLLLAVLDVEHYWLPDRLTWPLAGLGLVATLIFAPSLVIDHAIGAAVGFALLWGVAAAYRQLRGRHGLGGGDSKLFAAAGAWVGWADLPLVLLAAAATALVAAIILHARDKDFLTKRLPFGAFLAPAIWGVYLA